MIPFTLAGLPLPMPTRRLPGVKIAPAVVVDLVTERITEVAEVAVVAEVAEVAVDHVPGVDEEQEDEVRPN